MSLRQTIAIVVLCMQLAGCSGTYKYASYEVIHSPDRLEAGAEVRVVLKDETTFTGSVVRVEQTRVRIDLRDGGERTVAWEDIRLMEKFEVARAKR